MIVHRDLKPSNILVKQDETPKLLDFGVAKILDPQRGLDTGDGATLVRAMTPEYASPEQIRGEAVTAATDVYRYSLGVLLYGLLTGHHSQRIARARRRTMPNARFARRCRLARAPR